ncbi:DNA-binding domain-containing protein [Saccharospirillum mangrovi]|uniref:HvfC/BufC N-terminal domain-containing protein n=1 Tax=Saccharospirillum mangrovi TaxID=2161747 RepID=UPI0013007ACB|nr:putative DNA-binding domain-containing protein [Saccharospirillum mangrovi]
MQADFAQALLDQPPHTPDDLTHWNGADVSHRFGVYRNNVASSLIDALQQIFPVCCALTGVEFFRAMAREYVVLQPPQSPLLTQYGATFADFVAGFPPASALPYLADVARLERHWLTVYHSRDSEPMSVQALAEVLNQPDKLQQARLQLAPACAVLASEFPIHAIWSAHQPDSNIALRELRLDNAEAVLITRLDFQVGVHLIERDAATFLTRLRCDKTFAEAIDGLAFDLTALLHILVSQGVLTAVND